MSALFMDPVPPVGCLHTPSSVLRKYREFLCSELSAAAGRRRLSVLCLGSGGLRDAEAILLSASFTRHHSVTVLEEDPWRIAACKQEYDAAAIRYVEGLLDEPGFEMPGEYHFIYNLGGLAARGERDAQTWLARAVGLLAAGGTLLMASFTPEWARLWSEMGCTGLRPTVLRTEHQLAVLMASSCAHTVGHGIWRDDSGALAYLEAAM